MAELRWGAATDEGQLRAQNEDHLHAGEGLFVVADGMGGHLAGEVASEMAVARLRDDLPAGGEHSLDQLVTAIADANTEIFQGSNDNVDQAGMGTTVTAIAVVADALDGEVFGVANVGDSRAYVLRHGRLRQITIDHSFVQELVAEGAITRDEARSHPRRNIVTRALGIEPIVRVDSWTVPIIRGDRFLLCSDGLVDEITDDEITAILTAHPDDPDAAAEALVGAANAAGGRDNVSVVVVDVLEGDDPPDPTQEFDVVPLWADDAGETTGEFQIVADPPFDEDDLERDESRDPIWDPPSGDGTGAAPDGEGDEDTGDAEGDGVGGSDAPTLPEARAAAPTPAKVDTPAPPKPARKQRGARFARFVLGLGLAAVLILGFAILAAWARSGYFVAFDDDGRVAIYQGREDGFLWFDATVEAYGQYSRDELTPDSVDLVSDRVHFESQASAARFVAERLEPLDADDDDATADDPTNVPDLADPTGTTEPSG